jgi:hypothetical protein
MLVLENCGLIRGDNEINLFWAAHVEDVDRYSEWFCSYIDLSMLVVACEGFYITKKSKSVSGGMFW